MKESEVRDFIVDHFDGLTSFISNLSEFKKQIKQDRKLIFKKSKVSKHILISDLIKLAAIEKMLDVIPIVKNLKLVDKEFILLRTESGRGKQPSVDILAYNTENYCVALIELKISDSAEREAITELSAYNQGLQNLYRGLSALEVIWIPISTAWRTTTKSAIEFEMLWQNTSVLPLKLNVDYDYTNSKVINIDLTCFNPVSEIEEIECFNLFSYECFEAFDYCTMQKIKNKKAFINYITAIFARQKINGFVLFHKPVDMMFPYGFTLCVFNPYKGAIHKSISSDFTEINGEEKYYEILKEGNVIDVNYMDVDFRTQQIKHFEPTDEQLVDGALMWDSYWEKDFLGVGKFADNAENLNVTFMVNKIKKVIDCKTENKRAFGTPDFDGLIRNLKKVDIDSVVYLGVHLELISNKILIENKVKKNKKDFFKTISSFKYLKKSLREYNRK